MGNFANHIDYEKDGYGLAMEQSALIRAGRISELDLKNIAEEIESVGKSEKRDFISWATILLVHLLKGQFQPDKRTNSWRNNVEVQRIRLNSHMRDNPSLKSTLDDAIAAFRIARLDAETETGINKDLFPVTFPWSFAQMVDDDFWPIM